MLPSLARCAAEAAGAELAAVYVQPNPYASGLPAWRLGGHYGGDPEVLAALPRSYGEGGGVLAPLFQSAREVCEPDLLGVSGDDADRAVPQSNSLSAVWRACPCGAGTADRSVCCFWVRCEETRSTMPR